MAKLYIKSHFGVTPNELLNRSDLSFKAKGLYAYLQSKPDGWKFSKERIEKQGKDGRDSIETGLQELERKGYLRRKLQKDEKGKFVGYDYLLYEKPLELRKNKAVGGFSGGGLAVGGLATGGKPTDISNKDISNKDKHEIYNTKVLHISNKNTLPSKKIQSDLLLTVSEIYEYWNLQEIIVHRKLREDIKSEIRKVLKKYNITEIKKMIDLYTTILHGEEYFWDYKWNLVEFLQRGLRQFEGKGTDDYLKEENREESVSFDIGNNTKKVFKGGKLIREEAIL